MPRIERIQRQVALNGARQPFSSGNGYEAPARGLMQIGEAVSDVGSTLAQHVEKAKAERNSLDDFQAKVALAEFIGGQDLRQIEYDGAAAGDGRDHAANRLKEYDAASQEFMGKLPANEKVKRATQLKLLELRYRYGEQSLRTQQAQTERYYTDETGRLVTGQILPRMDGTVGSAESSLATVESILAGATGMSDKAKTAARKAAVESVYDTWLEKAGANAAAEADRLLESYDPEEGEAPGGIGAFRALVAKKRSEIERFSRAAAREDDESDRRTIREQQEATEREGLELMFANKLTKEWIEANADNLGNRSYARFMNAVTPQARVTDPDTYRDLLERADEDPDEIIDEASEAYSSGHLARDAYERIYGKATRAKKEDTRVPPWAKEQRSLLKSTLKPDKYAKAEERQAYQEALEQYDDFVAEQGQKLDRKGLGDFTNQLIERAKIKRTSDTRQNLPLPDGITIPKEAMSLDVINAEKQKLREGVQAGTIDEGAAKQRADILKRWERLLLLEQGPQKPSGAKPK
jgi:hypothetical protein